MQRQKIRHWIKLALIMIPMVSTIGYASVPYLQSRKTVRPARQQH